MQQFPKIRNVEPIPLAIDGEQMIALRDPHDLKGAGQMLVMSQTAFLLATLFDGTRSLSDIQTELTRMNGGVIFPRSELEHIVSMLDENLLIEGPNFTKALDEYRREPTRASVLAGRSFPEERDEAIAFLDEVMRAAPVPTLSKPIKGLVSPHIDIKRAQKSFAAGYHAIAQNKAEHEVYIIFGTSHYADPQANFILTRKNFATPLGTVEVDQGFIDQLVERCPDDLFTHEIAHKGEHSIEFQALFLQHVLGAHKKFSIVPILVGAFGECVQNRQNPAEIAEIARFLEALQQTVENLGKSVCYIAGVDLAHVGGRFGDSFAIDETVLEKLREEDMKSLQYAGNREAREFFSHLAKHQNKYRVCGLTPIYSFLQMLPESTGELLEYEQSVEADTGSVVTFATMAFC